MKKKKKKSKQITLKCRGPDKDSNGKQLEAEWEQQYADGKNQNNNKRTGTRRRFRRLIRRRRDIRYVLTCFRIGFRVHDGQQYVHRIEDEHNGKMFLHRSVASAPEQGSVSVTVVIMARRNVAKTTRQRSVRIYILTESCWFATIKNIYIYIYIIEKTF
jgi:hypothetical protein